MTSLSYEHIAKTLKVISHPCRLKIIDILTPREHSVGELQKLTGCKQSVTSQHLNKMKNQEILRMRRLGNTVFYSIKNKNVLRILKCLKHCPHPQRRGKCLESL